MTFGMTVFVAVFSSVSQLVCSVLYVLFVMHLFVHEVRTAVRLKWKYVREFWSYVNMSIVGCTLAIVIVCVWRYGEAQRIGDVFRDTHGYAFVDVHTAVSVNEVYMYLVASCAFLGTLKLVRVCRFNRRILLFVDTVRRAARDLASFSLMFSVVFVSFICLFYLLFVSKLWSCASVWRTAEMLFEMTLMKFDAHELVDAASFLGPLSFSLFILLVVFVCLSMFVTIISDSFRTALDNLAHDVHQKDNVVAYAISRLKLWLGNY